MNNLMALRKKHSKKAVDLAEELGVSRKHYYDLEKGNRRLNENHIKTFMEIYNCTADEILDYKYTKDDFENDPEELDLEIKKIIRFLTVKVPTSTLQDLRFPKRVVYFLNIHFDHIRRAHDLDFEITPYDIMQLVHEIDDFDFKLEILEVLEVVKKELLPHKADTDARIDKELGERFSGILDDQPNIIRDHPSTYEHTGALKPKEERDIARDLEKMLADLESDNAMAFHGEPMDEDDKEMLRISLENSMRLAKQMAKNKFTPNKYKDKK